MSEIDDTVDKMLLGQAYRTLRSYERRHGVRPDDETIIAEMKDSFKSMHTLFLPEIEEKGVNDAQS